MSTMILNAALIYAQIAIALAACLACIRAVRGPRAQDRVIGLDTIYVCVMLLFLTTGMRIGSDFFFEAAMVVGVMGFVATVALGKFLLRGEVIE